MVDLPSSSQKLMWSQIHLDILKSRTEEFIKSRPVDITSHFKPTRPGFDTVFRIQQQTPPEIILGVGDVIGNMRDALDHLIWELTVAYNGHPLQWTAWPIIRRRADWPLKGKNGKANNRSGEYKIRGIDPKYWPGVMRHQPFYGKRKDAARPMHALWVLDELRKSRPTPEARRSSRKCGTDSHHNPSAGCRCSRAHSILLPCQAAQRRLGNRTVANLGRAY
jgi:hypothetical protein